MNKSQHKSYKMTPPRRAAYDQMGVTPEDVAAAPKIAHWMSRIPGGFEFCLDSLRSSDDPLARRFLKFYDDPTLPTVMRDDIPVEAFCLAAGISPPHLMNVVLVAVQTIGVPMSNLVAAIALPDIVQTSVTEAMKPGGTTDREWQLKHANFLPMPKGSQVSVNVNSSATVQQATMAPSPEDSIRRLQDQFSESRRTLHAEENVQAALLSEPEIPMLNAMMPRSDDVQPE